MDGLTFSNSYFFEHCLGWQGVLIEASPSNYASLTKNRPCAITKLGAGSYETYTLWGAVFMLLNYLLLSVACPPGQDSLYLNDFYGESRVLNNSEVAELKKNRKGKSVIETPCLNIPKFFADLGIFHIDFFSLDVEGSELTVIESIDWESITIDVIIIENEAQVNGAGIYGMTNKDKKIENILINKVGMVKLPVNGSAVKKCQLKKKNLKAG